MSGGHARSGKSPAAGSGQTLFEFVRHWSRRSAVDEDRTIDRNGKHVLVAEAVASLMRAGSPTINLVAAELGIDQSGASRLVKDAVRAGYLELRPSEQDGRRREVSLTSTGRGLIADAHLWQERVFERLTNDWTREERDGFGQAMRRLLAKSRIA